MTVAWGARSSIRWAWRSLLGHGQQLAILLSCSCEVLVHCVIGVHTVCWGFTAGTSAYILLRMWAASSFSSKPGHTMSPLVRSGVTGGAGSLLASYVRVQAARTQLTRCTSITSSPLAQMVMTNSSWYSWRRGWYVTPSTIGRYFRGTTHIA